MLSFSVPLWADDKSIVPLARHVLVPSLRCSAVETCAVKRVLLLSSHAGLLLRRLTTQSIACLVVHVLSPRAAASRR